MTEAQQLCLRSRPAAMSASVMVMLPACQGDMIQPHPKESQRQCPVSLGAPGGPVFRRASTKSGRVCADLGAHASSWMLRCRQGGGHTFPGGQARWCGERGHGPGCFCVSSL